jgi:hypothetical protein
MIRSEFYAEGLVATSDRVHLATVGVIELLRERDTILDDRMVRSAVDLSVLIVAELEKHARRLLRADT